MAWRSKRDAGEALGPSRSLFRPQRPFDLHDEACADVCRQGEVWLPEAERLAPLSDYLAEGGRVGDLQFFVAHNRFPDREIYSDFRLEQPKTSRSVKFSGLADLATVFGRIGVAIKRYGRIV